MAGSITVVGSDKSPRRADLEYVLVCPLYAFKLLRALEGLKRVPKRELKKEVKRELKRGSTKERAQERLQEKL